MKDIADKLVLITGGASGMGRLLAFLLARKGARVACWDLNAEALKKLASDAAAEGFTFYTAVCDVSDREAVYREAKILAEKCGPLDVLVNNAGIVSGKTLLGTPDERIVKTMEVNVLALFWTTKAFLPAMLERDSGHIVTISSAAGLIGVKGLADYCSSKFAAFGFDESLRMELRAQKSKIRTTVVCPFFVDTGMFAGVKTRFPHLLPILKPEYAAKKIAGAILKNKRRLIMPRLVNAMLLLRAMPVWFLDIVADFFGISHSMDDFKGRG
jgi:all-trans-retinol dehydrogenase (NAD+)